ncbi:MAG: heavy-metal-associated domain-containing protein [Planctomycetota bacterium]|jgi:copper chaperone CopZ
MEEKTVPIPAINCGHCLMTIQRELNEVDGVESVEGDSETKEVRIRWRAPATWDLIRDVLKASGFPPQEG